MTKHLFANEKVMKQYLGSLLKEEDPNSDVLAPVAKLLEQVKEVPDKVEKTKESKAIEQLASQKVEQKLLDDLAIKEQASQDLEIIENTTIIKEEKSEFVSEQAKSAYHEDEFQALFFDVAGLTLAVPLKSLGGIHQLGEVNQLIGKPKWFKGVMLNRDDKFNVVDTAQWVMPEKYSPDLQEKLDYQYLITLGDSPWGLLAEKLVNNLTIKPEDVKWRTKDGKRPWLAGVIKEKMCALIDVENLNRLLGQGLDSREQ